MATSNLGSRELEQAVAGAVTIVARQILNQASWKQSCQIATTGDVDITTDLAAGQTVDGETLIEGWRVLVWQNADASENGIRIVPASGTAPRAPDFDDSDEIVGALVPVTAGAIYGGQLFRNTNTAAVVVDTDAITFSLFAGGGGGGGSAVIDHGNMGATETLDFTAGTWHRGTLDADCTITVTGYTVDQGIVALFKVTQDGTGGWGITWDADVVFVGDDQPAQTASAVTFFLLWSDEGDSVVYGAKIGAGGLTLSEEGSPLGLIESLDVVGAGATASVVGTAGTLTLSGPTSDTAAWMPLTTVVGGVPELVWDADGSLIPTLVPI